MVEDNDITLFFAILRDALWREKRDQLPTELSDSEATAILTLAAKQTVSGLVIDALFRHNIKMPRQNVLKSIGLLERIRKNSNDVNKGAILLQQLFDESGVDYVIVKGQVVAAHYPEPLLRQSGDIDYYCNSKNFDNSQKAIQRHWGIYAEPEGSERHVHYTYKGCIYEGHFSLVSFHNKKRNAIWQQILDSDKGTTTIVDGARVRVLSPTLHAFYVFMHLYEHLLELGIGLRQFCDLAVLLHYCKNDISMDTLRMNLKALGMEKAYRACGSILVDYLGLPENELGYSIKATDRRYGKKILNVVFYRGNMGHYNKRNGFKGWKHKVEASGIKISHFMKFMPLAPKYTCCLMWNEFKRNL